MRFPLNDRDKWYSAQGFGEKTDYGHHEAEDLNLLSGGDSDLGQPIYAIADGYVTSVCQNHVTKGFGRHIHIRHDKENCWSHCAHLKDILVSENDTIKEGQLIGHVGKSGTSLAHLHFAIKIKPTGIEGIAKTKEDLEKWTDPLAFIDSWSKMDSGPITQDLDIRLQILDENSVKTEGDVRAIIGASKELIPLREDKLNADKEIERLRHQVEQDKSDLKMESDANIALKSAHEDHLQSIGKAVGNGPDLPGILQHISILTSKADLADKYEKELGAVRNNNADLKAEIQRKNDAFTSLSLKLDSTATEIVKLKAVVGDWLNLAEVNEQTVLEALHGLVVKKNGLMMKIINYLKKWLKR